jgi:hypothetical protein
MKNQIIAKSLPCGKYGYKKYSINSIEKNFKQKIIFIIVHYLFYNLKIEPKILEIKFTLDNKKEEEEKFSLIHTLNYPKRIIDIKIFVILNFIKNRNLNNIDKKRFFDYLNFHVTHCNFYILENFRKIFHIIDIILLSGCIETKFRSIYLIFSLYNSIGLKNILKCICHELRLNDGEERNFVHRLLLIFSRKINLKSILPFFKTNFLKNENSIGKLIFGQIFLIVLKNQNYIKKDEFAYIISIILNFIKKKGILNTPLTLNLIRIISKNKNLKLVCKIEKILSLILEGLKTKEKTLLVDFIYTGGIIVDFLRPICIPFFIYEIYQTSLRCFHNLIKNWSKIINTVKICIETYVMEPNLLINSFIDFIDNIFLKFSEEELQQLKFPFLKLILGIKKYYSVEKIFFLFLQKLKKRCFVGKIFTLDILVSLVRIISPSFFSEYFFIQIISDIINLIQNCWINKVNLLIEFILKNCHRFLIAILKVNYVFNKKNYFQITGLFKWEIKNSIQPIKIQALKAIRQISPILEKNNQRLLLGNLNIILINNLSEINQSIMKNSVRAINSIIKFFPGKYIIPPLYKIFPEIFPIIKNKEKKNEKYIAILLLNMLRKSLKFFPKNEWTKIFINIIEFLKSQDILSRKYSIILISKITEYLGPYEILLLLLNQIQTYNKNFKLSLLLALTGISDICGTQFIFPVFFRSIVNFQFHDYSLVFKAFIYVFEYLPFLKFVNYINPLFFILNEFFLKKKILFNKDFYILIVQISEKLNILEIDLMATRILKKIWVKILKHDTGFRKFMIYILEKIIEIVNWSLSLQFFLIGCFHVKNKIRSLFFTILISIQKKKFIFSNHLNNLIGSNRYSYRNHYGSFQ